MMLCYTAQISIKIGSRRQSALVRLHCQRFLYRYSLPFSSLGVLRTIAKSNLRQCRLYVQAYVSTNLFNFVSYRCCWNQHGHRMTLDTTLVSLFWCKSVCTGQHHVHNAWFPPFRCRSAVAVSPFRCTVAVLPFCSYRCRCAWERKCCKRLSV